MARKLIAIEVHWWIKDSMFRKRYTGTDLITEEHLNDELKHIAWTNTLSDFEKGDANSCLSYVADSGYDPHVNGRNNNAAFVNFCGAINVTICEPIDFGVNKIRKIYEK